MAYTLSRIDRKSRTYDLSATVLAEAAAVPPDLTGVDVALLPPRGAPTASTVWFSADYDDGSFTVLLAGPDADSTGALVVPASADIWMRIADAPEVDAEKLERIIVLGGGTPLLPATGIPVVSVNGKTGSAVTLSASDVGAQSAATLGADVVADATVRAAFVAQVAAPTGVAATDTARIQAAINAAATAGGGIVQLRAGIYIVTTLTIKNGVILRGEGRTVTTLKLANGTNASLITVLNFATLTGTSVADLTAATYGWAIERLAIDGNKTNQTGTSWGIQVYGHSFSMDELHIRNCLTGGIYNEFSFTGTLAADLGLPSYEPRINNVDIHHCDGWGWRHRGPTDLLASRVLVWKCGLSGSGGGIWHQSGNGTSFVQCHTYGNVGWSLVSDAQFFATGCQIETGEKGAGNFDAGGLWIRFDDSVFSGGSIYRISAAGVPQDGVGLRLGESASGKYATRAYVATNIVGFTGADADHAAIHFSADASSTIIATVGMNHPSGAASAVTPITGTPDAGSRLQIHVVGSSPVKQLYQNSGESYTGVKAQRTTDLANVNSGVFTPVPFDGTDVWDTNSFHDPVTNNTRITIPTGWGGKYRFNGAFSWLFNATGRRIVRIRKNGSVVKARDDKPGASATTGPTCINLTVDDLANPGDYYELEVLQDSGTTLSSDITNGPIFFAAEFLG